MLHTSTYSVIVAIPSCCADIQHENKEQTMHKASGGTISCKRLDVHQPFWRYTVREICNR